MPLLALSVQLLTRIVKRFMVVFISFADMDRSSAATLDAYPADPDSFAPESYADRDLERAAVAASAGAFSSMVKPSLLAASECGNMYAGESLVPHPASRCLCVMAEGKYGFLSRRLWRASVALSSMLDS